MFSSATSFSETEVLARRHTYLSPADWTLVRRNYGVCVGAIPAGGHMGREAKGWTDPVIFKRITMPWLLRALEVKAE